MNKKYSRASLEALVQKAGVISREMDAKLERMEALAVKYARRENEMRCAGELTLLRMRRKWRKTLWVDVPLCVLVVVDVVMRWV